MTRMLSTILGIMVLILGATVFLLTGCAGPNVEEYSNQTPKLDIRDYFDGKMIAYGTIQDFTGKVVSRFKADVVGSWDGNTGTLDERFRFDDGKKEERTWTLQVQDEHHFTGEAHDVIGTAEGKQYGNALNMKYVLEREVNGRTMQFTMDDWMYLIDDSHLVNKTTMHKYGIPVAALTIGFYKVEE